MAQAKAMTSSLGRLDISASSAKPIRKPAAADSWEDEASDNDAISTPTEQTSAPDTPGPPPPTPASPTWRSHSTTRAPHGLDGAFDAASPPTSRPTSSRGSGSLGAGTGAGSGERRPEKSTAVASRLIAAGIGQKAPRRTQEEREYDRAMKAQEVKRREQARLDEVRKAEEAERAKRAVWDD